MDFQKTNKQSTQNTPWNTKNYETQTPSKPGGDRRYFRRISRS